VFSCRAIQPHYGNSLARRGSSGARVVRDWQPTGVTGFRSSRAPLVSRWRTMRRSSASGCTVGAILELLFNLFEDAWGWPSGSSNDNSTHGSDLSLNLAAFREETQRVGTAESNGVPGCRARERRFETFCTSPRSWSSQSLSETAGPKVLVRINPVNATKLPLTSRARRC
jgi:hypothetical protein